MAKFQELYPFLDTGLYLLCMGGQDLEHNITCIAAYEICIQILNGLFKILVCICDCIVGH